jgi:hypothetical protein
MISSAAANPASRSPTSKPTLIHPAGDHVLEQQRRILGHRLVDVDHVRQDLVLHVDEADRLARDGRAGRGHRGDSVPLVENLLTGHDVASHVPEIDCQALGADVGELVLGQIGAGHHGLDAGQRLRARGVDGDDARVGVRAPENLSEQRAGHVEVRAEHRRARHLRHAVGADRAGADPLEGLLLHRHRKVSPV